MTHRRVCAMSLGLDMRARRACAGRGIWRGSKENIRARKGLFWRHAQAYMYLAKIAVYIEPSQHTCNESRGMHHQSWARVGGTRLKCLSFLGFEDPTFLSLCSRHALDFKMLFFASFFIWKPPKKDMETWPGEVSFGNQK